MRTALRVFLCAKIMATVSAVLGGAAFPAGKLPAQQGYAKAAYSRWFELLIGNWERADGIWYLGIAQHGYTIDPAAHAFMPLYPLLIRAVSSLLPFPPIVAALLVSHVAFFFGLSFFYRLALTETDAPTAERALIYLALFPGALFFFAPYTESLFFCLATGSFLLARTKRWWLAGLLGLLLSLTRNVGVLLAIPLFLEWLRQRRSAGERPAPGTLASLALIPLGLLAWIAWSASNSGDPLIFIHAQSQWQRQPLAPWSTLARGIRQAWAYSLAHPGAVYVFEALAVSGAILLTCVGMLRRRVSLPLSGFVWVMLLPSLTAPFEGRMLMSCLRFVAVLFPVFLVLAREVSRPTTDQALRFSFAAAYGIAVAMYVCNQLMF